MTTAPPSLPPKCRISHQLIVSHDDDGSEQVRGQEHGVGVGGEAAVEVPRRDSVVSVNREELWSGRPWFDCSGVMTIIVEKIKNAF